jgi:predicted NBD/HSP70 family sugar kinase
MEKTNNIIIGGNSKLVRSINRATILNLIRERQPISRVIISKITRLNKSTVSNIVSELIKEEYLIEELVSDNKIGRNPLQLRLNQGRHFVGAVNFDTNLIRVAIVNLNGKILKQIEIQNSVVSPHEYVKKAITKLNHLKSELAIRTLQGIGVTISGLIDPVDGHVTVAPNLGWKDVKLKELFRKYDRSKTFIRFENDADASALGELWYGQGEIQNHSNFVFVSVGAGIGTGIVIDNKVIEGISYAAGEFGHMTLHENGVNCVCGNKGCWEAYASDKATLQRYLERIKISKAAKQRILIDDICNAANQGESEAVAVIKETGKYLGEGIASILRALDPPVIVIGGRILQVWSIIYPEILKGLSKHSFFGLEKKVKILPSSLSERPRLIGSATMAINEIFRNYRITR